MAKLSRKLSVFLVPVNKGSARIVTDIMLAPDPAKVRYFSDSLQARNYCKQRKITVVK
jgi:hypothetical protein